MDGTGPRNSYGTKRRNYFKSCLRREAISLDTFNKRNPETISIAVEQKIQHILRTLPVETEAVFERLFELGIDLGIDKKGKYG